MRAFPKSDEVRIRFDKIHNEIRGDDMIQNGQDNGLNQVAGRTGGGGEHGVPRLLTHAQGIDFHRSSPTEKAEKDEHQADRIEVDDGVERQPPHMRGGVVSAAMRHPGVRHFVQGNGQYDHGKHGHAELQVVHHYPKHGRISFVSGREPSFGFAGCVIRNVGKKCKVPLLFFLFLYSPFYRRAIN